MIDQARLDRISLHTYPAAQVVVASLLLTTNYYSPFSRTRIRLEGTENIPPQGGAIFVMNHTDRFNYWPFQYEMWRTGFPFTATWVKGKYYEKKAMGAFMDATNNIPVPSKGYVLSKDFSLSMRRKPTDAEYAALKDYTDARIDRDTAISKGGDGVKAFLQRGWPESPGGDYAESLENRFNAMMRRVVEINREGLAKGLNLLIFPQGTRSKRLTAGHVGAAQMILHTGAPVIPVGCNGSDKAYPGNSVWSKGGNLVYRIGKPYTKEQLTKFAITEPFTPFTRGADKFNDKFRGLTDFLMDRINELLDPEYQYDPAAKNSRGGAKRFL